MKRVFKNKLEAIDWIAAKAEDEAQFEVLREQLMFNFIYTGRYFLNIDGSLLEVVWLDSKKKK